MVRSCRILLLTPHNRPYQEDLWRSAGKFELMTRMLAKLRATKHRVLIFCQMTQVMTVMEDFLNKQQVAYLRCVGGKEVLIQLWFNTLPPNSLDGSTKSDDRGSLLAQFNAPDSPYDVFILSTRSGKSGRRHIISTPQPFSQAGWASICRRPTRSSSLTRTGTRTRTCRRR